jgi:hypothetical protein
MPNTLFCRINGAFCINLWSKLCFRVEYRSKLDDFKLRRRFCLFSDSSTTEIQSTVSFTMHLIVETVFRSLNMNQKAIIWIFWDNSVYYNLDRTMALGNLWRFWIFYRHVFILTTSSFAPESLSCSHGSALLFDVYSIMWASEQDEWFIFSRDVNLLWTRSSLFLESLLFLQNWVLAVVTCFVNWFLLVGVSQMKWVVLMGWLTGRVTPVLVNG